MLFSSFLTLAVGVATVSSRSIGDILRKFDICFSVLSTYFSFNFRIV